MEILTLPANWDNWIYVHPYAPGLCAVVDPSDAAAVRVTLDQEGLDLTHILVTHHHADHIGGIAALKKTFDCKVYSPDPERIAGTDVAVEDGAVLVMGDWTFTVLSAPGHTTTGVCFYGTHPTEPGVLYAGDTLFSAGCGRLFEGSAEQMDQSLRRLAALPDQTRLYPGHNYTEDNLRFAQTVEPDNETVKQMLDKMRTQVGFVPTTLAEEKQCNPFLRCGEPTIQQAVGQSDPVAAFAELRQRKDRF